MAGFRLTIATRGFSKEATKLEKFMEVAKRPEVPMMQSAVWLAGQTIRCFEDGGRPEKWAPIGVMTAFIRAHREDSPTSSRSPMNDLGRLKGSFIPTLGNDGVTFGASTNVEYAGLMQTGGKSDAREVKIAGFDRRRPGASIGLVRGRKKYSKDGPIWVNPYTLHMKAGSDIPARPFFPNGLAELDAWGYADKIRQVFKDYFTGAWSSLGGSA